MTKINLCNVTQQEQDFFWCNKTNSNSNENILIGCNNNENAGVEAR